MSIEAPILESIENGGPILISLLVIVFVFFECGIIAGLFLPGDSLLFTTGMALAQHHSGVGYVWALSACAVISTILGNAMGYQIGTRTGEKFIARKNGKYLNEQNLQRVNTMLNRHGFWAVLVARWIPWVRTLCPLVAGAAHMNRWKFTLASTLGALMWTPVILLGSFYFSGFLTQTTWLFPTLMTGSMVLLVIVTIVGIVQYRREMSGTTTEVTLKHEP
jgi:membrane-associated protein